MVTVTCHDGLQIRIRFERKNKNTIVAELSLQRDGHRATELDDKLWRPVVILPFVSLLTDLAKATGQEELAADFTNWAKDYEKVIYRNLRSSKEREVYIFFRSFAA